MVPFGFENPYLADWIGSFVAVAEEMGGRRVINYNYLNSFIPKVQYHTVKT